jgi:threonine dehydrogenase-like Zn-dependent dehydrogenase
MIHKMESLIYKASWDVGLAFKPLPTLTSGNEVIVEVKATGVCGTDIGIVSGEYEAIKGVTLGHESSGIISEVGSEVIDFSIGDRVVIDPTFYCGKCRFCRTNRQNHCERKEETETGVSRDGTFAKYYRTTPEFLHKIPDNLEFSAASLVEPLSCAITGVNQLKLHSDLRVVVLGGGPMGILYSWALFSKGITGCIVERSKPRAKLLKEVLPGNRWEVHESIDSVISQYLEDSPIDIFVDTTGRLFEAAMPKLARGGQFLAVGLKDFIASINLGEYADRSLTLLGSIDSLNNSFSEALSLLSNGYFKIDRLITHEISLKEYNKAFQILGCDLENKRMRPPEGALKVVVVP